MTRTLWAIEAHREGKWILLPNVIMVDRKSAEFELKQLRDDANQDTDPVIPERYRLVRYERGVSVA